MNLRNLILAASAASTLSATALDLPGEEQTSYLQISNVVMRQLAQTQDVYIDYELSGGPAFVRFDIYTNDVSIGASIFQSVYGAYSSSMTNLISDGTNRIIWKARADWKGHLATHAKASVAAYYTNHLDHVPGVYMVVDLSDGTNAASYPISYTFTPPDPTDVTCCSNQLWLKRVETNTFKMGSPTSEGGRQDKETQHDVTLTNAFFIGVFPVTRAQYTLVMGSVPTDQNGSSALCPVNMVSYNNIRGAKTNTADNIDWPDTRYKVLSNSFFGMLRSKTGGSLCFDLPTEAEWECACRAGTTTAWNDGSNFETNSAGVDDHLGKLGWYYGNSKVNGSASAQPVGRKAPNAWGLYDCHGNVWEWCLDRTDGQSLGTASAIEPVGALGGAENRVLRGGSWLAYANLCRSAYRGIGTPSGRGIHFGFRAVLVVGP